jgi:hypothetical protein
MRMTLVDCILDYHEKRKRGEALALFKMPGLDVE